MAYLYGLRQSVQGTPIAGSGTATVVAAPGSGWRTVLGYLQVMVSGASTWDLQDSQGNFVMRYRFTDVPSIDNVVHPVGGGISCPTVNASVELVNKEAGTITLSTLALYRKEHG